MFVGCIKIIYFILSYFKTTWEKPDMSQILILFVIPLFFLPIYILINIDLTMQRNCKITYVTSKEQLKILYPMEKVMVLKSYSF